MLNFQDFTTEFRQKFQKYTSNCEYRSCDLAFANLFVWKFYYSTQMAENEGFIFIKYCFRDKLYFMLPIGNGDLKKAVELIMENAEQEAKPFRLQGLSPKMHENVEKLFPCKFEYFSNRDYFDYIYLREELATLAGKKFQPKRNHINQFLRNFPNHEFLEISPEIIPQCLALEWLLLSKNDNPQEAVALEAECRAITTAFDNFQQLDLQGLALKVNDKIVAFTYGSPISGCVFDVAVEKADTSIIGAYAAINNEFAKRIPQNFLYINREEDLGLEGLRKAKLSYQPVEILEKFTAKLV
ncbi:MAG: phosphatidylglycerol lysyltransferase domain-containing protein [Prevotellaceae bacterium]|jgi:hypothetical protein|nr:phosphatidylglycerol lysyltransferase domain-containing protein [Prevotellaceae bacterium]